MAEGLLAPALLGFLLAAPPADGPPFDVQAVTPHAITMTIDTSAARDVLALLSGGPDAPATLRRLKASPTAAAAIRAEGISPEDYFGRLVATVAGTPDPALASYLPRGPFFSSVLDEMDREGPGAVRLGARRIASMLPPSRPVTARVIVIPFLGISGFADVAPLRDGETLYLAAELPRLTGDLQASPPPREVLLRVLREVCSEAWRTLFRQSFRKAPAWREETGADFAALLDRTVAEGPPTLFLIPDEFFPLIPLLDEPITRCFERWGRAAEELSDPKRSESKRRDILTESTHGDFWGQYAPIVGAEITDAILRRAGRELYLRALDAGPRSVVTLYLKLPKGAPLPDLGKAARKALEASPTAR